MNAPDSPDFGGVDPADEQEFEELNRYCGAPDWRDTPSDERLAAARKELVEIATTLPVASRWRTTEACKDARDFAGAIALELLCYGGECNAHLLRVEDRLLNLRALIDTNVKGKLA